MLFINLNQIFFLDSKVEEHSPLGGGGRGRRAKLVKAGKTLLEQGKFVRQKLALLAEGRKKGEWMDGLGVSLTALALNRVPVSIVFLLILG